MNKDIVLGLCVGVLLTAASVSHTIKSLKESEKELENGTSTNSC